MGHIKILSFLKKMSWLCHSDFNSLTLEVVTHHPTQLNSTGPSFFERNFMKSHHINIPDKGLVTNYGEGGGLQNGRGAREVLPLRKGGGVGGGGKV